MGKATDEIYKIAKELAKDDSTGAGGWEAVDDRASALLQLNPHDYLLAATIKYLDSIAEPPLTEEPKDEV